MTGASPCLRSDSTSSEVASYEGGMKCSWQDDVVDEQAMAGKETLTLVRATRCPAKRAPATVLSAFLKSSFAAN